MHRISIVQGDITSLEVDAIVNAANSELRGGGGVDGAIHAAAGPELLRACEGLAPCPAGQVRLTPAFRLPAKYVVHAVGPVYQGGAQGEELALRACYRKALHLALALDLESIAFPAISCGAYGYPLEAAAHAAVSEIARFLAQHDPLMKVVLVAYDDRTEAALASAHPRGGAGGR